MPSTRELTFGFDVNEDGHVHLESKTFEGVMEFDLDAPSLVKEGH